MKQKLHLSILFILLTLISNTYGQSIEVSFVGLPVTEGTNLGNSVENEGFTFTFFSTNSSHHWVWYDWGARDPHIEIAPTDNTATEIIIRKTDGSEFKLEEIFIQKNNLSISDGIVTGYKNGVQIGTPITNLNMVNPIDLSSYNDLSNIDEFRISTASGGLTPYIYDFTYTESTLNTLDHEIDNITISITNSETLNVKGLREEKTFLVLYSFLGKQILKTSFNGKLTNSIKLPNQLSSGIYIVKIETSIGNISKKIAL